MSFNQLIYVKSTVIHNLISLLFSSFVGNVLST